MIEAVGTATVARGGFGLPVLVARAVRPAQSIPLGLEFPVAAGIADTHPRGDVVPAGTMPIRTCPSFALHVGSRGGSSVTAIRERVHGLTSEHRLVTVFMIQVGGVRDSRC